MYCPKCATENNEGVSFCRACGTNLSLVPQAITGKLPTHRHMSRRERRDFERGGSPDFSRGVVKLFTGLGFLAVTIALSISHTARGWWFWLLIPAFASLGKGIAEILSARSAQQRALDPSRTAAPPARVTGELPPQPDFGRTPQPSITEDTTRHLDAVARPQDEGR